MKYALYYCALLLNFTSIVSMSHNKLKTVSDSLGETLLLKVDVPIKRYKVSEPIMSLDFNPHKSNEFITEDRKRVITTWYTKQRVSTTAPETCNGSPCIKYDPHMKKRIARSSDTKSSWIELQNEGTSTKYYLQGHTESVRHIEFNPYRANQLASCSADGTIKLWNLVSQNCISTLQGHEGGVRSIAFDPHNHQRIISVGQDGTIKLWNMQKEVCIATLTGHKEDITCVAFDPCRKNRIATGSIDATIKVWDLVKRKELLTSSDQHTRMIRAIAYNKYHKDQLISGDHAGRVIIWNSKTRIPIHVIQYSSPVTCITVDPHTYQHIAIASHDNVIEIVNLDHLNTLLKLLDHNDSNLVSEWKKILKQTKKLKYLEKHVK